MPTLTVTPNPTKPDRVDVEGVGFDPTTFIALVFDGAGTTIKIPVKRDGTFAVGQYVASTKPDGSYRLEARKHGTKTVLASTQVVVRRALTPPPTPVPTLAYTSSIAAGSTISGKLPWTATVTAGTPIAILFWIDGVLRTAEAFAPYVFGGDGALLDTTSLTNGPHKLEVIGRDAAGVHAPAGGIVTVNNVVPPGPEPGPVPPLTGPIQPILDGVQSGGSVDLTGWQDTGRGIAKKPMTIKGGLLNFPPDGPGMSVWSSGVVFDGFSCRGPQGTVYDGLEACLTTRGAPGPISGLVVKGGTWSRAGYGGMYLRNVVAPHIEGAKVEDVVYAGIFLLSAKGGLVKLNDVRRVGVYGASANSNNAYGIAATNQAPTDAISTDVTIIDNLVEDVPTWHAYDTHGGRGIQFIRNTAKRSRHGIFITGGAGVGGTGRAVDTLTDGNLIYAPAGADQYAIVYVYSTGGLVTRNKAFGWPAGHGLLTKSGNDPVATAVGLDVRPDNAWAA